MYPIEFFRGNLSEPLKIAKNPLLFYQGRSFFCVISPVSWTPTSAFGFKPALQDARNVVPTAFGGGRARLAQRAGVGRCPWV